jgi:hypothetical protein
MPGIYPIPGLPGVRAEQRSTHYIVFKGGNWLSDLPGGKQIDGVNARDSGNSVISVLRPGLLMGKITSSGLYAPSVLGTTIGAYTSGGTTITVSAAQAVEIARRVGQSGNLTYIGPPSAAGTNATLASIAFSAINTTTGVITTSTLGANLVAGSFVCATDGSATPLTIVPDGYGILVVDNDGSNLTVPFPEFPVAGILITANIIYYSGADTSLQAFVRASLSTASGGKFVFDDAF